MSSSCSGRHRRGPEMALARVGGGNDDADGFLVEAFEAAVALEVLQVAAQRAFQEKLRRLLARNQPGGKQALGTLGTHGPALTFSKCLAQEREVGEGVHCIDAAALQLVAEQVEIEPCFQVVQAGLQEALAMQTDPEA